jgi:chemotaxis protein methyltransferase CheR
VSDPTLDRIVETIRSSVGSDFGHYARATVRRRLEAAASAEGLDSLEALARRIARHPERIPAVVSHLHVAVTSMFRDAAFQRALRDRVVPALRGGAPRVWHCGCATGEEVWSMAILLEEGGLGPGVRLYGTDANPRVLEPALEGRLPLDRMREYTASYHLAGGREDFSRYYVAGATEAVVRPFLRSRAVFARHDVTSDGPIATFDLVLCRNVLMYFDAELQGRVLRLLASTVRTGGILALGRGEDLDAEARRRFEPVDDRERIFRRTR